MALPTCTSDLNMHRFAITLVETTTTFFTIDANDMAHAEALAEEMAEERAFPADARERASREIAATTVPQIWPQTYPAPSPELVAARERIESAKRMKPEALAAFMQVVEATIAGLQKQPFHVQVACGLDALTAERLILRGEG